MSNQVFKMTLSLGLALAPMVAWGQSPAPSLGKIGVINIQAVIGNTAEGKKAFAELDKKYAPRKQDLQEQSQAINALQDQLQKQGTTLSDEEQRRQTRDLQEKQTRFKRAQEDAQADFNADQQDVVNRIGSKLVKLINDYAPQNGYAMIIEGNPQLIYYAAPQIDLTEDLIKRYDAANPVAAEAGAGSSPSGAVKPAAGRPAAAKPPTPKPPDKKP